LNGRRKSVKGRSGKRRRENVKERSEWAQVKALEGREEVDGKAEGGTEVGEEEEESNGSTFEDGTSRGKRKPMSSATKCFAIYLQAPRSFWYPLLPHESNPTRNYRILSQG
jgi:hypothetical protein